MSAVSTGKSRLIAYDSDDSAAPVSNLSDAMDVDDKDVEERKEVGGEYVYVPDVIRKRDNWVASFHFSFLCHVMVHFYI
jgi:hypothetical protein